MTKIKEGNLSKEALDPNDGEAGLGDLIFLGQVASGAFHKKITPAKLLLL